MVLAMPLLDGPPSPEVAEKLMHLGWCMVIIVILSVLRLVVGDSFTAVLGDSFVIFAILGLLRDDPTFGSCAQGMLNSTAGFCGQGGLSCLWAIFTICGINVVFDTMKVIQFVFIFKEICMHVDPGKSSAGGFITGDGFDPTSQSARLLMEKTTHAPDTEGTSTTSAFLPFGGASDIQSRKEFMEEFCPMRLPALAVVMALQVVAQLIAMIISYKALKTVQNEMMASEAELFRGGPGDLGGFSGTGGFGSRLSGNSGGRAYSTVPAGGANQQYDFHGHASALTREGIAIQQALAASAAQNQSSGRGADEADRMMARAPEQEDPMLQEALRQSREEEAHRQRAEGREGRAYRLN